jgi:hypothetical protein
MEPAMKTCFEQNTLRMLNVNSMRAKIKESLTCAIGIVAGNK